MDPRANSGYLPGDNAHTTPIKPADALPEKIEVSMNDLAGLAGIANGFRQALAQVEIFVYRLEQNGASIGAAVRLIKGNGNRPVKMCSEKYRLCGRLSHRKASFGVCNLIGVK
jgi:hypothetical protein